jgi:low affinity Fe/Cu permease
LRTRSLAIDESKTITITADDDSVRPEEGSGDAVIEKAAFGVAIGRFSTRASEWAGSTTAFIISLAVVLAWLATGPLFAFSETWQLVINTITSVATFVMVFLIQRAQNKDSLAMHLKLSELIAAVRGSADRMMVVEELTEAELRQLHAHYLELVQARKTDETTTS